MVPRESYNDQKDKQAVLNIFSRNVVMLIVFILTSACSGMASHGNDASTRSDTTDRHQATTKAAQSVANANYPKDAPTEPAVAGGRGETEKLPDDSIPGENSVYFSFGEATIDEHGIQFLRQQATLLKENPLKIVTLIAFTDNLGSRSFNLAISEARINAVVENLRRLGVPQKQIRRKSAGLSKLSSSCNTQACRQKMRRVELNFN